MKFEWTKPTHRYDLWQTVIHGVTYSIYSDLTNDCVHVYCGNRKVSQEFNSVKLAVDFVECNWRILNDGV